jgi:acetate kinase
MMILVLNAGSSSLKCALYCSAIADADEPIPAVWEAYLDWSTGGGVARLQVRTVAGRVTKEVPRPEGRTAALDTLLATLDPEQAGAIDAVGHRVVHGGREYRRSVRIDGQVRDAIARLAELAPVHNPVAVELIDAVTARLPEVTQVAVFDTAFHADLPQAHAIYPGPYAWWEEGIQRYGFHGISHQYTAGRAAHLLGRNLGDLRLITCHLGNGCSLAAVVGGRSVDTTMGFTPLEGVAMGSRSGSVDPGILIYLLRHRYAAEGLSIAEGADRLERLLNRESGLAGLSGVSNDMRDIRAAIARGDERAALAFEVYAHRLRGAIGSLAAVMGGLDGLAFTGGVGSHSADVRAATCATLGFLGIALDPEKNQGPDVDRDISAPGASARVLVVFTQEEWAIARECLAVLAG